MTLAEMAAAAVGQNGRLACPTCGCQDFRPDKVEQGQPATFRRKMCRHCGFKMMTIQPPERFLRDVIPRAGGDDDEGDIV